MKKRIDVRDLAIGMGIVGLDRPWIETPFMFQGFTLQSEEQLAQLQAYCEFVYVDADALPREALVTARPAASGQHRPVQTRATVDERSAGTDPQASLDEQMAAARDIYRLAQDQVQTLFDDVRSGRMFDIKGTQSLVAAMVDSVTHNPNALVWFTALKDKDHYTALHSINVSVLASALGSFIGVQEAVLKELALGALLHDIGKLRVPTDILNKPDRLTRGEYEVMKQHTTRGFELLEQAGLPASTIEIAFAHHEANDGSGYPRGLMGSDINFFSQLVSIVDKYDAITSDRMYRAGISPQKVITLLYSMRGHVLDEHLVNEFIRCLGVYPIGSLVELSSGEVGIVMSVNPLLRLRPKVLMVRDEHKKTYLPPRVVDLEYAKTDRAGGDYGVRAVLDPGSYNINSNEYIRELHFRAD